MQPDSSPNDFFIWGIDDAVYGPVELPTLVAWIKDERVLAETWLYARQSSTWKRASDLQELQMFFRPKDKGDSVSENAPTTIRPGILRRVKILGGLSDAQLTRFAQFMELVPAPQWSVVVKQGDHGDTMYMILEGELRARLLAGGRETILTTLSAGEFFGDLSLFDHGPRSADVVANVDSTLLKVSASGFEKLIQEAPDLAAPFLLSTIKTLSARIRADNKRLHDSMSFSVAAGD